MNKSIKNTNAVICKLGSALTRATNHRLEVASKEKRKREEIVERRKTEAMAAKCQRTKRGISLSSKEKEDYESNTGDKMDLD